MRLMRIRSWSRAQASTRRERPTPRPHCKPSSTLRPPVRPSPFPGGTYRVNAALTVPSYLTLRGEGYQSCIDWRGAGTFVTLASKTQVKFGDRRIHLYSATAVEVDLSNSFRCSLTGVIIEGEHLATTGTTYQTQKGIIFRDNAGDNRVIDCDLNNLGLGIETASAQNYVIGGTFGTCWRSISGGDPTGAVYIAGISVTNTTFVGGIGATNCHIYVGGPRLNG